MRTDLSYYYPEPKDSNLTSKKYQDNGLTKKELLQANEMVKLHWTGVRCYRYVLWAIFNMKRVCLDP